MFRMLTVGIVLSALACASPRQESREPDLSIVRTELESLWTRYSAAAIAGDADAIARLYTDSAYFAELGIPTLRGNSAVRVVATEIFGNLRVLESSIRPELTEQAGDRVLQFGTYRDVLQASGKPAQVVVGRFAAVFERDSEASWRVSRLLAFPDSAVALTPQK